MRDEPETTGRPGRRPLRERLHLRGMASTTGREFVREIAVVVIGVFLALAADQAVDTLQWKSRVRTLQAGLRTELEGDLVNAWETQATDRCASAYLDGLEAAIVAQDHAAVSRLRASGWPFGLRRWQDNVWTASLSTAVADHLPQQDLSTYAVLYTGVQVLRQNQFQMRDFFEEATTARFDLPGDARLSQLASLGKLRSIRTQSSVISRALLAGARTQLAIVPPPGWVEAVRSEDRGHCQQFILGNPAPPPR